MILPLVATPCYGRVLCMNYVSSALKLSAEAGINPTFHFMGGQSLITVARNDILEVFMDEKDFTHLFWIDADIGWEPEAFKRLLRADKDVIGGIYSKKDDSAGMAVDMSDIRNVDKDGIGEIGELATGFMCIKRAVLEKMSAHYTSLMSFGRAGKPRCRLFDTDVDEFGRELPEDYAFCWRWTKMGGKVHVDTYSRLTHQGTKLY